MAEKEPVLEADLEPLTPRLGAVLRNFDTRREMSDAEREEVVALLVQYKVLFFPSQGLDQEEHARFARQFGELVYDPIAMSIPTAPGLSDVDNVPFFHADVMFEKSPPKWSMLQLSTVPEVGGDTMFVDLVSSYADLSEAMRTFLEPLTVFQTPDNGDAGLSSSLERRFVELNGEDHPDHELLLECLRPRSQPLVRVIPESGRVNYWACPAYSKRIDQLEPGESDAVLSYLFRHMLEPQYCIRWRWSQGDIAFWDQRTTLHRGVKDYAATVRRFGRRASIAGSELIPAASSR